VKPVGIENNLFQARMGAREPEQYQRTPQAYPNQQIMYSKSAPCLKHHLTSRFKTNNDANTNPNQHGNNVLISARVLRPSSQLRTNLTTLGSRILMTIPWRTALLFGSRKPIENLPSLHGGLEGAIKKCCLSCAMPAVCARDEGLKRWQLKMHSGATQVLAVLAASNVL
jgi:hypothetical protein